MIVTVLLGDFLFDHTEVPEKINGGGEQLAAVHQLVGGTRVVDSMGRSDSEITWTGLFQGLTAEFRIRYLDTLRAEGKPLTFSYLQYRYTVLIKSFTWEMMVGLKANYSITLIVIKDLTKPITIEVPSGFDDVLLEAMQEALDIDLFKREGGVEGALGELSDLLNDIPDLGNPSQSEITAITSAIGSTVDAVETAINEATSAFHSAQLGSPLRTSLVVNNLNDQSTELLTLANLYRLKDILETMQQNMNLLAAGDDGQRVTVAGGDLYDLAAKYYGDATLWNVIAEANKDKVLGANGFIDVNITGVVTLTIPPKPATASGGILNA